MWTCKMNSTILRRITYDQNIWSPWLQFEMLVFQHKNCHNIGQKKLSNSFNVWKCFRISPHETQWISKTVGCRNIVTSELIPCSEIEFIVILKFEKFIDLIFSLAACSLFCTAGLAVPLIYCMSTSCQSLLELDIYIKVGLSDSLMWEVVMRKLTSTFIF